MNLENVFQEKVKKPAKEKKLEVITSVDAVVDDLMAYFEKNKYGIWGWMPEECKEYFDSCCEFLQSFKLTPHAISVFNDKVGIVREEQALGIYLSASIQTSYNQEFNNFKFNNVYAHGFGAFLKGQPENPIKITAETLEGGWSLWCAEGCLVAIQNYKGAVFGYGIKNCTIKSGNKELLKVAKDKYGLEVWKGENNRFELIK